jgi:hypothetical protein
MLTAVAILLLAPSAPAPLPKPGKPDEPVVQFTGTFAHQRRLWMEWR